MSHKDFQALAILKHAVLQRAAYCTIPVSKVTAQIFTVLYKMRKIRPVRADIFFSKNSCKLWQVNIIYDDNLVPLLKNLKIVSTPTRRIYATKKSLYMYYDINNTLVSTSRGILVASEAIRLNLGGEVLITFS